MTGKIISNSSEWTMEKISEYDAAIARIAHDVYELDTYPVQIEIISSELMLNAYASVGLPINYYHWSFGKSLVSTQKRYQRGRMGLAYEMVINSNPCIAYLMEENTLTMQALVIAHAAYGHNSFFKGNELFRTWTSPDAIVDYMAFARNYIRECEEKYGEEKVELLLDSCHALMNYGVDRYVHPSALTKREEKERQKKRQEETQQAVNDLWRTLPSTQTKHEDDAKTQFPKEPQENILYFIEKNAPMMKPWEREVVRIVRKIAQYFYPQRQTKVMNEGWATFWHYTLINHLYDEGRVSDGFMIEFLQSHTNVIAQPPFDSPRFSGINPYALGFAMMCDIRRICEQPTDEDRHWFPLIAGKDWLPVLDFAMRNFKDESFIAQYLSPKLIRDLHLFAVRDDDREKTLEVTAIHNERGYRAIRTKLAQQYDIGTREPHIEVTKVNVEGDRTLTLRHYAHNRRPLHEDVGEVRKHLRRLWGFPVRIETEDERGIISLSGKRR